MTTFSTNPAQAAALASRWNERANDRAQIEDAQAHLLFGDNADADLEDGGQHMVEVPASQSKTGNPITFYITDADVTAN
jgi:hypothetical protein